MITKVKTKKKSAVKGEGSARERLMAKAKKAQEASKKRSESGGGGGGKFLYLDSETKTTVRVFPTWKDDPEELFYQEIIKHFGLGASGNEVITCLGDECPICAHVNAERDRLKKKLGKEAFKSKAWKAVGRIAAKTKNLMNVVVLTRVKSKKNPGKFITKITDNDGAPLVYEAPATVIQSILTYFLDDTGEWGVFYDKDTRYDFTIEKTGEGLDTKYTVTPTKLSSKLSTDQYLDKLHDLEAEAQPTVDPDDAEKLLRGEAIDKPDRTEGGSFSKQKPRTKLKNSKARGDEEEEGEDEAPKKIKKKVKKKSAVEDELMSAATGVKKIKKKTH